MKDKKDYTTARIPKKTMNKLREKHVPNKEIELLLPIFEKLEEIGRERGKIPRWSIGSFRRVVDALCPFHDDHNPSFNIYISEFGRLKYKCFACGVKGNIWDLAKKLKIKTKRQPQEIRREKSSPLKCEKIKELVEKAHKQLLEIYDDPNATVDETNYFVERHFLKVGDSYTKAQEFIKRYHLGVLFEDKNGPLWSYSYRLIIPYFDENGEIVWFNARRIDDEESYLAEGLPTSKYLSPIGKKTHLYNEIDKDMALEKGFVFIVEGELDAISFMEATERTIPVMAIPGTGGNYHDFLKTLVEGNVRFFILTDPDPAGQEHAKKLNDMIRELGGISNIVHLFTEDNELFKGDINDALKEFGKERLNKMLHDLMGYNSPVGDLWYIMHFKAIAEKRKSRPVYPTGIKEIDEALGGGYREGLHIIGGITSVGKTAIALKIATNNAQEGRPVIYISYEQSKDELWARVLSSLSDEVQYTDIKDGNFPDIPTLGDWKKIKKVAKYLKIVEGDAGMADGTKPVYTISEIENLVKANKIETGIAPLVIIDYIQRMAVGEELKKKDIRERVDFAITGLQTQIARQYGSPVIALSSLSRGGYEISQQTPHTKKLQAFKESGGIEFTGYTVVLLWKATDDEIKEKGLEPVGVRYIHFDILKNRENGHLKNILLEFSPYDNSWEAIE